MNAPLQQNAMIDGLGEEAYDFLRRGAKLLIDGALVESQGGGVIAVKNPADGQTITHVPEARAEDIDRAVRAARRAFDEGPWGRMTPAERSKLIWRLGELIEKNKEEFAQLDSLDNGKPIAEARAADVPISYNTFYYMAGWATKLGGTTLSPSLPQAMHAYTLREPVGVVAQIIPWNFPLMMAAWKLAPALAAGCTVVLKAAEDTPLSALRLGELVLEAGFPPGVVNIVTGYGEIAGAALAAHDLVDKVAFTGSTEVGKHIVKAAAGNLKRVSLELGGKAPTIVFPDADLERTIAGVTLGSFFAQGQVCVAATRLYVHKTIFDKVIDGVASAAAKIKVGRGLDPNTQMGPLVSDRQLERVSGYVDSGRSEGAEVVVGGKTLGTGGYFIEPTILTGTRPDMKVVREEIFGPVVVAEAFDDAELDALAAEANNTIYGLAASVWTQNISVAHKMAKKIKAGTVWLNCHHVFDPVLPFGGYKQSGWGRENGAQVLEAYLETKSVIAAL
ncbi:aldehyde dehydrogenase family protein [Burkholderia anthina]|uniref:aldehyde dehydrogenase family protein n=1 Tax=Burkholderia anthina TaxID=179879 RepID=UPI001588378A|nr:aldehyde dehydrogenase family protein [Burkholderia anthina]